MAWNSTYESRAGIFTLTLVSAQYPDKLYDYTFKATLSFTQERNLTDTLNKFSLDVVDDGSSDFHSLENVILSGITSIRISYGIGTDNQISWSGFVYDYVSTFFGQNTKLTLIGYITLSNNNLNDYAGHYYRVDWSPMIPYRINFNEDWSLFQTSDYVWQRDGTTVDVKKISEKDFLKPYEDAYNKAVKEDAEELNFGWHNDREGVGGFFHNLLEVTFGNLGDGFKDADDWADLIYAYIEDKKNSSSYAFFAKMSDFEKKGFIVIPRQKYNELNEAKKRYQLYETLYNSYFNKYKAGSFTVDFQADKIKNAVFSMFPSNFSSDRQVVFPVPDIFIQWDGILPKPAFVDTDNGKEWTINFDTLLGTMNDVTAFGLSCDLAPGTDKRNEKIEPTVLLKGNKDFDNKIRLLKMNNATFICVSDAKALAEKRWGKFTGDADFTEAASSASTSSSTSTKTLSDNAMKIYNYFHGKGWSDAAIASLLGNGELESGLVPNKLQGGSLMSYEDAYAAYPEDKQTAHAWGLWQWDPLVKIHPTAGRSWATRISGDRNLIETQCAILESQLNTIGWTAKHYDMSVADFKVCTDVQKTARAFLMNFEICSGYNTDEVQQKRALKCSSYLNGIQGFSASNTEVKTGNSVVPKSWFRSYYNYCLSAYRSALPLQYGGVYISDIVEKLCKIEGWTSEITPTMWSSYEAIQDALVMNGRNALDYIVNVLAPISTSENGYTGYIVRLNDNHLTFKPAIPDRLGTINIRMGYNVPDSPVLSFSCKTRGNFIMYGVAEAVSTVTSYSNESAVLQTYAKSESFIESKFSGKSTTQGSNWFSKGLFSYYGFLNNLEGYNSFFSTLYTDSFTYGQNVKNPTKKKIDNKETVVGTIVSASLSTALIRSTPYSSLSNLSGAEVLSDLSRFEKASIKAEITIIGDNRIVPNSYIEVVNMTKRGRHYTSGIYWINKITDTFSKGSWTQKLECNRYDTNLDFFNRTNAPTISQVDASMQDLVDSIIKPNISASVVDQKIKNYLSKH